MKKLLGLILLLTIPQAWADVPHLVWCNSCSSMQMQAAALHSGLSTTYVGDPINRVVKAYQVYLDVEDTNPPTRTREADQIASDPQLISYVDAAIDFYNASPVGWKKHVNVYTNLPAANSIFSENPAADVYDIINAGRKQNDIVDWLNSGKDIGSDLYRLVGLTRSGFAMFHLVDQSAAPQLAGTIYFSDGSHIDAYYDNATGKLKLDLSTARDSHNNTVPYLGSDGNIHNLGGERDFGPNGNPDDLQSFLNEMYMMHVPIYSGTGGSGGAQGYSCIKYTDPQTHVVTYTCERT